MKAMPLGWTALLLLVPCMAVSPHTSVAAQQDNLPTLRVSHELFREYHTYGVTWSADSTKLAAYSTRSDLITVWNAAGAILKEIMREGDHYVGNALAFVGGNTEIVSRPASYKLTDAAASVFDVETGKRLAEIPGPHPGDAAGCNWALGLVASPDQSLLAAAFGGGIYQPVVLYSTKDWSKVAEIDSPRMTVADNAQVLSFSADGRLLAVGLPFDILIYDIRARRIVQTIKAFTLEDDGCCISAVAFNPDASEIAVASSASPSGVCLPDCRNVTPKTPIRLFRIRDGSLLASYPTQLWPVWHMGWSPDGRFIAFIARDSPHLWSPSHPKDQTTISLHVDAISLAFARDGRHLATSDGNYVTVFEVRN